MDGRYRYYKQRLGRREIDFDELGGGVLGTGIKRWNFRGKYDEKKRRRGRVFVQKKYSNLRLEAGQWLYSKVAKFCPCLHAISLPIFPSITLCYSRKYTTRENAHDSHLPGLTNSIGLHVPTGVLHPATCPHASPQSNLRAGRQPSHRVALGFAESPAR